VEPAPSSASLPSVLARVKNPLWTLAALFIVVAGLKEAGTILVPIMLAVMMAIICSPAVSWLERRRIPNVAAVVLVVAALMGILTGVGALIGSTVASFRESIPHYSGRVGGMLEAVTTWLAAQGLVVEAAELRSIIEPASAAKKALDFVGSSIDALASVLSNSVLVILTMVLILIEGHTVPAKLRALAGDPNADISKYRRIATEVQSYLAVKTMLSLITGLIVGVWCAILGVDFAALWGLIAFLLNYIPNIGSIIAAVPAVLLATVQLGWGSALAVLAGYVVVNTVVGNVAEPMWMGKKLGLSTTVVFLSLVVWGWIWGAVGMLLSVPLTMIIKIMLENSRDYGFIATMLDVGPRVASEPGARAVVSRFSSAPPPDDLETRPTLPSTEAEPDEPHEANAE
jgi:AI-2 transport protein TqsA